MPKFDSKGTPDAPGGFAAGEIRGNLPMRKSLFAFAAAATVFVGINAAQAMPVTSGAMRDVIDSTNLIEKTAIYIVEGRRYCFYFSGWHGPGWYRCGYAFRRGFG